MSEKLVKALMEFRNSIPELEGLLIGKTDGTKIWADSLKDLNHEFILSSASVVARATRKLSESIEKKEIKSIEIEMKGGYASIIISRKGLIIGFYGEDARAQHAIIKQNLRTFAKSIEKLL